MSRLAQAQRPFDGVSDEHYRSVLDLQGVMRRNDGDVFRQTGRRYGR